MKEEIGEGREKKVLALNLDVQESSPRGKGMRSLFSTYFGMNGIYLKVLMILLSILVPLAVLYGINAESFNHTYNGRAYYLFFVWLVVLELAFAWDKYNSKLSKSRKDNLVFGLALILPTLYVGVANFLGLNNVLVDLARPSGIGEMWLFDIPLAVELLVFAVLFGGIFWLAYKKQGLKGFSPAIALIAVIGVINMITIFFPFGAFTPFQLLSPPTASASVGVLKLMGFKTMLGVSNFVPTILLSNGVRGYVVNVGWPCAGVDSLVIYSVVMTVFLKKASIPWLQGAIYFGIGAGITFFINVLRVVTICLIGLEGGDIKPFHNFYGQFYSVIWIVSYILLIVGSRILWNKYKVKKDETKNTDSSEQTVFET